MFDFVRIYEAAILHQDAYVPVNSMDKTNESVEVTLFWLLIYNATSAFVLLLVEYCDWESVCIVTEYFITNVPWICYICKYFSPLKRAIIFEIIDQCIVNNVNLKT